MPKIRTTARAHPDSKVIPLAKPWRSEGAPAQISSQTQRHAARPSAEQHFPAPRSGYKANTVHQACTHGPKQSHGQTVICAAICAREKYRVDGACQHDQKTHHQAGVVHRSVFGQYGFSRSCYGRAHGVSCRRAAERDSSFSPHIAFKMASKTAKPTPKTQVKYHMSIPFSVLHTAQWQVSQ